MLIPVAGYALSSAGLTSAGFAAGNHIVPCFPKGSDVHNGVTQEALRSPTNLSYTLARHEFSLFRRSKPQVGQLLSCQPSGQCSPGLVLLELVS